MGSCAEHGKRPSHWVEFDINEMKHIMTGLDCVGYEHSVYDPAKLDIVVISVHSKLVAGLFA